MAISKHVKVLALAFALVCSLVDGHGQMVEPPARPVLYKYFPNHGFVDNWDYYSLNCGGMHYQYGRCGGMCGVSGDPCDDPNPPNEAGGAFATGFITRTYTAGQQVHIVVEVTANHQGYFEFRLCPNNDVNTRVKRDCLDKHVLQLADGSGTRVPVYSSNGTGMMSMTVSLPPGLTCSQCVLQWRMHNGNSWGYDPVQRKGCVGCGPQEEFYGCSDIAIVASGASNTQAPQVPTTKFNAAIPTTVVAKPITNVAMQCKAINLWAGIDTLDRFCADMCSKGNCPADACLCQ